MKKNILFILIFIFSFGVNAQNIVTFDHLESNVGTDKTLDFNVTSNIYYRLIGENITGGPERGDNLRIQRYQNNVTSNIMTFSGTSTLIHNRLAIGGFHSPDSKLTVKGKIHAEEVKVDLNVPGDYVFEKYFDGYSILKPEYTMPTLAEVESFIKTNKHLPEIPSAKEIQENGLHLSEMTNLLLQKIEELTLYTIEQEKRIESLEKKLNHK